MNIPEIERLVELVQKANIGELTLRHEGARITIRKTSENTAVKGGDLVPYSAEVDGYPDQDPGTQTANLATDQAAKPETISIFSPLVGHFRHIKPMVGLGAKVAKGQTVGVIEAVKLINEIASPAKGIVLDVLVDDGQAVEYGQELFTVQPEH